MASRYLSSMSGAARKQVLVALQDQYDRVDGFRVAMVCESMPEACRLLIRMALAGDPTDAVRREAWQSGLNRARRWWFTKMQEPVKALQREAEELMR